MLLNVYQQLFYHQLLPVYKTVDSIWPNVTAEWLVFPASYSKVSDYNPNEGKSRTDLNFLIISRYALG
jgi:hypothetical protein